MTPPNVKCPDCGGSMAEGFIPDTTGAGANWKVPATWVSGTPERSVLGNLKTGSKEQHTVQSYRCESCGLLKFYALDPWA